MKRRGCIDCRLIEPRPGQWVAGFCPSCTAIRQTAAKTPTPSVEPAPPKDPALQETVARLHRYLAGIADLYPNTWRDVDRIRAARGRDIPQWPSWCFMPFTCASAIADRDRHRNPKDEHFERYGVIVQIATLAAWRTTQGIYRFDPTVAAAVCETPIHGEIPADVLHAIPEWCVYIETPGGTYDNLPSPGFFASVEYKAKHQREELHIVVDTKDGNPKPALAVHLNRAGLKEGIESAQEESAHLAGLHESAELAQQIRSVSVTMLTDELTPRINLLLYLCSINAEMLDRKSGRRRPRRPLPTKTKDGMRMFPAERPVAWEVAYRLGAAIRHAQEAERSKPGDGTHARPRPHVRRAHWHSFWTGPKAKVGFSQDGERKLILRWIPPIPVNVEEGLEVVPTVRNVK